MQQNYSHVEVVVAVDPEGPRPRSAQTLWEIGSGGAHQTVPASRSWAMDRALPMSREQTPAARPYFESLARVTASSLVLNFISCITGPKISSVGSSGLCQTTTAQ